MGADHVEQQGWSMIQSRPLRDFTPMRRRLHIWRAIDAIKLKSFHSYFALFGRADTWEWMIRQLSQM